MHARARYGVRDELTAAPDTAIIDRMQKAGTTRIEMRTLGKPGAPPRQDAMIRGAIVQDAANRPAGQAAIGRSGMRPHGAA